MDVFSALADCMTLGPLLQEVRDRYGEFELLDHWKQGEFHHDVVIGLPAREKLPC